VTSTDEVFRRVLLKALDLSNDRSFLCVEAQNVTISLLSRTGNL